VAIFDLETEKTVEPARFFSKSRNCPYAGKPLKGWASLTLVKGEIVYRDGEMLV